MCSTPKMPSVAQTVAPAIATPTYAVAKVQKAGANTRQQAAATSEYNVKTSALGLGGEASVKKTKLGE